MQICIITTHSEREGVCWKTREREIGDSSCDDRRLRVVDAHIVYSTLLQKEDLKYYYSTQQSVSYTDIIYRNGRSASTSSGNTYYSKQTSASFALHLSLPLFPFPITRVDILPTRPTEPEHLSIICYRRNSMSSANH